MPLWANRWATREKRPQADLEPAATVAKNGFGERFSHTISVAVLAGFRKRISSDSYPISKSENMHRLPVTGW